METIEEIKLKWQKHNRDNGLSWNEVAELVNQVALTRPTVSEGDIDRLWYKFAGEENDFGNLFLGRDAYDLLMDELNR